jgi:hypothetical protein
MIDDYRSSYMDRFKLSLIVFATLSLTACASSKKPIEQSSLNVYQKRVLEEEQRTNEILAKAAALSAKSLAVFVRTEQAVAQKELTAEQIRQARFQRNYIPVNMEQRVTYGWDSAPEPLLRSLADNSGYTLDYINERPPIPKTVTVSSKSRMITDYIDIIRQQTKGYIDFIYVDDKSDEKSIKVKYSEF